jgi:hypothetical protein
LDPEVRLARFHQLDRAARQDLLDQLYPVVPQHQLFPQDRLHQLYLELRQDRLAQLDPVVREDLAVRRGRPSAGFASMS